MNDVSIFQKYDKLELKGLSKYNEQFIVNWYLYELKDNIKVLDLNRLLGKKNAYNIALKKGKQILGHLIKNMGEFDDVLEVEPVIDDNDSRVYKYTFKLKCKDKNGIENLIIFTEGNTLDYFPQLKIIRGNTHQYCDFGIYFKGLKRLKIYMSSGMMNINTNSNNNSTSKIDDCINKGKNQEKKPTDKKIEYLKEFENELLNLKENNDKNVRIR